MITLAKDDLTGLRTCDQCCCANCACPCHAPTIGDTRTCPDCGRPQHYTGTEYGWAHDALTDTWHCNDPRKAGA